MQSRDRASSMSILNEKKLSRAHAKKKGKPKKECGSENRTPIAGLGTENANHSATATTGSLEGSQVSYVGLRQNHEKFCGLREKTSRPLAKKKVVFFKVAQLTGG